jgi:WhiB family redox-sensing transcriptional regulator
VARLYQDPIMNASSTHRPGDWSWQSSASCRTEDPALFFQPDGERPEARRIRLKRAKAICGGCPVSVECQHHSLLAREPFGVWGGLSERERLKALGATRDHQRHRLTT